MEPFYTRIKSELSRVMFAKPVFIEVNFRFLRSFYQEHKGVVQLGKFINSAIIAANNLLCSFIAYSVCLTFSQSC